MRLNVIVPNQGDYLGRGKEYVHKILTGTRKFMPADIDARYWVVTDDPSCVPDFATYLEAPKGAIGWWVTLSIFKPGMLPRGERCVYFDLDMIPVGELDYLHYTGPFSMLRDPNFADHVNSSVTMWTAGEADKVWEIWEAAGMPKMDPKRNHPGGDQYWTEQVMGFQNIVKLQDIYPGQVVSYKEDCRPIDRLPDNARMLMFTGIPKPHQLGGWVGELWNRPC